MIGLQENRVHSYYILINFLKKHSLDKKIKFYIIIFIFLQGILKKFA